MYRKIAFVPGLYKIFDEILVNAADNKQRDSSMDYIKVDINAEEGSICVQNDGEGMKFTQKKLVTDEEHLRN